MQQSTLYDDLQAMLGPIPQKFDDGGLVLDKLPERYKKAYESNKRYIKDPTAKYNTDLGKDEQAFREWLKKNKVPFEPDAPVSDYDMRGFYKGLMTHDPHASSAVDPNDSRLHYSDWWKTPYHETFSRESQYATPNAPYWEGDRYLKDENGNVLFDDAAPKYAEGGSVSTTSVPTARPTPASTKVPTWDEIGFTPDPEDKVKSRATGFGIAALAGNGNAIGNIGAGLAGGLAADAAFDDRVGKQYGEMVGGIVGSYFGPVGTFVGAFLGGAVGSLFGGHPSVGPNGNASIVYDPTGNHWGIAGVGVDNGGDKRIPTALGNQEVGRLNSIIDSVGGKVVNGDLIGNRQIGFFRTGVFEAPHEGDGYKAAENTFDTGQGAVDAGVLRLARAMRFEGGDPYVKAAIQGSQAKTAQELMNDIQFAQTYSKSRQPGSEPFDPNAMDRVNALGLQNVDPSKVMSVDELRNDYLNSPHKLAEGGFVNKYANGGQVEPLMQPQGGGQMPQPGGDAMSQVPPEQAQAMQNFSAFVDAARKLPIEQRINMIDTITKAIMPELSGQGSPQGQSQEQVPQGQAPQMQMPQQQAPQMQQPQMGGQPPMMNKGGFMGYKDGGKVQDDPMPNGHIIRDAKGNPIAIVDNGTIRPVVPSENVSTGEKSFLMHDARRGNVDDPRLKYASGGQVQVKDEDGGVPNAGPIPDVVKENMPPEATADDVPAFLSKGEFVMDAATVSYFGVDKLIKMQEKAHQDLAEKFGGVPNQNTEQMANGGAVRGAPRSPRMPNTHSVKPHKSTSVAPSADGGGMMKRQY